MEFPTEIQEVREGEVAELLKVGNRVLETIGISFAISKIGHLRRDSWVKVNGIELLSNIRLPRAGTAPTHLAAISECFGNWECTYSLR
jgi:hypothetical protein